MPLGTLAVYAIVFLWAEALMVLLAMGPRGEGNFWRNFLTTHLIMGIVASVVAASIWLTRWDGWAIQVF